MTGRPTSERAGRTTPDLRPALQLIHSARSRVPPHRSLLVAVTGIDASGKGWIASRLRSQLVRTGVRVAELHTDDWLTPRYRSFGMDQRPEGFYAAALDFEAMFGWQVLPLRRSRGLHPESRTSPTAADAAQHPRPADGGVDVILLEGIFLLKRAWRSIYDLSVWIDCSFATALERALMRRQEKLSAPETIHAYRTLYFPAQELHIAVDEPRAAATLVVGNDPALRSVRP